MCMAVAGASSRSIHVVSNRNSIWCQCWFAVLVLFLPTYQADWAARRATSAQLPLGRGHNDEALRAAVCTE